jgi:acyl-CoA hydrolase
MKGKQTSTSKVTKTEVVCPNDTNPVGILKGGVLVQWMDIAAAVTSQTHSEKICVTASIDKVNFHAPARNGDIMIIESNVTRAFTTSMEIYVEAFRKKIEDGNLEEVASAYFTFVALDKDGKPASVPALIPSTAEENLRYEEALQRKTNK